MLLLSGSRFKRKGRFTFRQLLGYNLNLLVDDLYGEPLACHMHPVMSLAFDTVEESWCCDGQRPASESSYVARPST
jgi:hypothetical protein